MFTIDVLTPFAHWISSALLSVCNSRMPTGTKSIHSPQLYLTCSLAGFSTHTYKHTQQHLSRTGKVNEQEWFVCKRGTEHTMRFAVKLFCQLWRLWEHTVHTNSSPRGPDSTNTHNYQQQMTELGWGGDTRKGPKAASPLTEGDRWLGGGEGVRRSSRQGIRLQLH